MRDDTFDVIEYKCVDGYIKIRYKCVIFLFREPEKRIFICRRTHFEVVEYCYHAIRIPKVVGGQARKFGKNLSQCLLLNARKRYKR